MDLPHYRCTVFRGSGVHDGADAATLPEARVEAVKLYRGRYPVGIYLIYDGGETFVENYPDRPLYMSAKDRDRADRLKKIERGE